MTEQSGNEQFSLEFFSTARQDIQLRVFCILLARAATSVPASVFVPVTDVCVWLCVKQEEVASARGPTGLGRAGFSLARSKRPNV